ncbi:MAG: glycerol-3-phosphate dehydrogenase [Minwuia sp.]|uniref:glycerol-3-phosphate dehydrogenase n=1 Tax=Minwuia sp. TaxID=2493630 RepID=UPI003A8B8E50
MSGGRAEPVDLMIVGGGINGCGIARDAAGRGYSVALAEMQDLAQGTSSGSTKLIHGGLRYLEHYEFRLVRESLMERERLWAMAPHIVWPLRFVLPHHKGLRPRWMLRLGLFLYDHLGGRKRLPATRSLNLRSDPAGKPLKDEFVRGFEYSDCWVDDARLVVLNARDAAGRGADIRPRNRVTDARVVDGLWQIGMEDTRTGELRQLSARMLVNAAGPWVDQVLQGALGRNDAHHVRLVQGSHIVVRKLFEHDRCYIFQNADDRIIFAIPYEQDFTLIGTTDRDYEGDPGDIRISPEETDYLLAAASEYFREPVERSDIVWTYSGVRPLYDDGASRAQEATRDYVLTSETAAGAPLINVFGGKITTYRRLSEEVLEKIDGFAGRETRSWTGSAPLPGGDMPVDGVAALNAEIAAAHPFLDAKSVQRLVRTYGTDAKTILDGARSAQDLGEDFGAGLTEAELRHLADKEWAMTADDVLLRRTKLALRLDDEARSRIDAWLTAWRAQQTPGS